MKKFFFTLFFLTSISSFSQSLDCNCSIGFKAGVNYASITDISELSYKPGFLIGIFAGVKFNDNLGIQGDLIYSQQGADSDDEKIDLNYLNFPVVLEYYIIRGLNIHAGPQFGMTLDDNVKDLYKQNEKAEAELFEFSGVVGIGYDLSTRFKLEARYNFGLTDIAVDEVGKNTFISFSLGYSFL